MLRGKTELSKSQREDRFCYNQVQSGFENLFCTMYYVKRYTKRILNIVRKTE